MRFATRTAALASVCVMAVFLTASAASVASAASPAFGTPPPPRALNPHIVAHFTAAAGQSAEDLAVEPHGFVGANGVAVHNGAVWVSNSDAAAVLRIAILPDGTAGPVSTAASGLSGLVDNITVVGPHDTIIVTLVYGNEVAAVGSDGTL